MKLLDLVKTMEKTFIAIKWEKDDSIVYSGMSTNVKEKAWYTNYIVKNIKVSTNEHSATIITIG